MTESNENYLSFQREPGASVKVRHGDGREVLLTSNATVLRYFQNCAGLMVCDASVCHRGDFVQLPGFVEWAEVV